MIEYQQTITILKHYIIHSFYHSLIEYHEFQSNNNLKKTISGHRYARWDIP